jgi:hypothetical protein
VRRPGSGLSWAGIDSARVTDERNLNVIQRAFELWNEGEIRSPEFSALLDENVLVHHPRGWPEPGPTRGIGELLNQYERMRETFAVDSIELAGIRIDGDRALIHMRWNATGDASGVDTGLELFVAYTLADARIAGMSFYWTEAEALEDLGWPPA